MKAKTIKGLTVEVLRHELASCTADGFRPTLALVFLSIRQNISAVCNLLDEKNIAIFGATTAGEFIDGEIGEGSVVMMLLDLDPAYFRIQLIPIGEDNLAELGRQIGRDGKKTFSNPAFLLSYSGLYTDGEMIVNKIEETAGQGAIIFGGMAGDDLAFKSTCVFTNQQASDNGILTIFIDNNKVTLEGHAVSGWRPIGTVRTITGSERNIVYTMDDEPALDVVMKFLGISPQTVDGVNEAIMKMGSYFPILIQREDGYLVTRTSMFANVESRQLVFSGNVPQGSQFRFALPPDFEVVDEVISRSREMKKNHLPEADALIMFSCVARHVTLGPLVSEEIDGVKQIWNSPLVGFFSYGEIGKAPSGRHEYYNNTCCLVALKEKT